MSRRLVFRPRSEADLAEIWDHTVQHWSVAQAKSYLTGLNDTLLLLCDHPEIARLHAFTPPVRVFPFRSHLLIFVADEAVLEVIRILHMRSDWKALLTD